MNDDTLVSDAVAAQVIGVDPVTLSEWRRLGCGPRFMRRAAGAGPVDCYRVRDIRDWLARGPSHPCSAAAARGGT